jgi:hypothetical protein
VTREEYDKIRKAFLEERRKMLQSLEFNKRNDGYREAWAAAMYRAYILLEEVALIDGQPATTRKPEP